MSRSSSRTLPEPLAQERRDRKESSGNLVRWRISVGKRHRVEPRQIVGALANEGGLKRADFGRIDIKPNFSLVELPPDLSAQTLDKLSDTRISGILIDLQRDKGPAPRSGPPRRGSDKRVPARPHTGKKPRHKHRG